MIDHLRANLLLDAYGGLLTQRQSEILLLYLQEDFSLAEIQEQLGISRAAVQSTVKKALKQMEAYEDCLHLLRLQQQVASFVRKHPEYEAEFSAFLQDEEPEQPVAAFKTDPDLCS